MADWLIAAGGDATDPSATTGSWATAFATLEAAFLDANTLAGDSFFVRAGDNVGSYTALIVIPSPGTTDAPCYVTVVDPVTMIETDDSATVHLTTTTDIRFDGITVLTRFNVHSNDDTDVGTVVMNKCIFSTNRGTGNSLTIGGGLGEHWDSEIIGGELNTSSAQTLVCGSYGSVSVRDAVLTPAAGESFISFSGGRGNTVKALGLDLSQYASPLTKGTPEITLFYAIRCLLPNVMAALTIPSRRTQYHFEDCIQNGGDVSMHFYRGGSVMTDTSTVRTATKDAAGTLYSMIFTTNSATIKGSPIRDRIVVVADVDLTTGVTVSVEIAQISATPIALNASDIVLCIAVGNTATGYEFRSDDGILAGQTPSALPLSTAQWFDSSGAEITTNIQKNVLSVAVPAIANSAAALEVFIEIENGQLLDGVNVCPDVSIA